MHYFLYIKLWTKTNRKIIDSYVAIHDGHTFTLYHIPNGSIGIKANAWNIPSAIQLPMKLPN